MKLTKINTCGEHLTEGVKSVYSKSSVGKVIVSASKAVKCNYCEKLAIWNIQSFNEK